MPPANFRDLVEYCAKLMLFDHITFTINLIYWALEGHTIKHIQPA